MKSRKVKKRDSECHMKYDYYSKHRDYLVQGRDESFDNVDKAIFQWAAGAIVLSITFIKYIGLPVGFLSYLTLCGSWMAFTTTIFSYLLALLGQRKTYCVEIEKLDYEYEQQIDSGDKYDPDNYRNYTEFLNSIMVICFIFGCLLLLCYAITLQIFSVNF